MGKVIMSGKVPKLVAPVPPVKGLAVNTLAEGSIVKLNENGSPVEFYVAKHDYESTLNGAGRTLLVRKDAYNAPNSWNPAGYYNVYSGSELDTWFNGTYKSLLDSDVQSLIGTTNFYVVSGNYDNSLRTLAKAVFTLSVAELGLTKDVYETSEGFALPIASLLKVAYCNGSAVRWWTRSPMQSDCEGAFYILTDGSVTYLVGFSTGSAFYPRPCFTIPSTALFDPDTLEFMGVA